MGGLVDVGPTILDLLRWPHPDDWQGRSLFSVHRTPRVYFFATWSALLFGYREGDTKFIFDATENTYEVYDLRTDPYETVNLAARQPPTIRRGRHHLAAWVQYQRNLIDRITSDSPSSLAIE